jgi:hypothetical protein
VLNDLGVGGDDAHASGLVYEKGLESRTMKVW